jgi:2-keto-4-pentenoate hydratase/2-oxohepta-3-ene-1,7-dioic acid hydratase in catechol pathway
VTLAQDFSARDLQMTPTGAPQFSLGKSFPGFLPMGPELVTVDELEQPDAIALHCEIDGVRFQDGNTDDLIFSVPEIIAFLSSITPLSPGDVIITGTPAGVGMGQTPQRFLRPGETVVSRSDAIGTMRHSMTQPDRTWTWPP